MELSAFPLLHPSPASPVRLRLRLRVGHLQTEPEGIHPYHDVQESARVFVVVCLVVFPNPIEGVIDGQQHLWAHDSVYVFGSTRGPWTPHALHMVVIRCVQSGLRLPHRLSANPTTPSPSSNPNLRVRLTINEVQTQCAGVYIRKRKAMWASDRNSL